MKSTLNIDDHLLEEARKSTGVQEKTALVRMGLEALIAQAAAQRLAQLGGAAPGISLPPRKRSKAEK